MKLLRIYKENKALIKENTKLKTELKNTEEQHSKLIQKRLERESYLTSKIDNLLVKKVELENKIVELSEKNYELAKKLTNDTTDKIKKFINELDHNIQADKDNGETLISGVSCDYVIERLKDIIK